MSKPRNVYSRVVATVILGALAISQSVRADSLADRSPADAIGFASWSGSDALGKSYDESHLKGLLEAMNLPQFISQAIEEEKAKEGDADSEAAKKAGKDFLTSVLKSPSAFYFGPVDFADADNPKFKAAFYSKVGAEKAKALAAELTPVFASKKKEGRPPVTATVAGDFLLVTIGEVPGMDKRLEGPAPADGLSSVAAYQKTMKQVGGDSAAVRVYVNIETAIKAISDGVEAQGEAGAEAFPKMVEIGGWNSLRTMAFAGNFDGANWASQIFIGMGEKRLGFTAMFDAKPLNPEVLKMIPKNAEWAGVGRFDAQRLLTDMRDAITKSDPQNGGQGMDAFMRRFYAVTGVDLEKDVAANLGDAYVFYAAPDATGHSFRNATMATKLKDGPKVDDSLSSIESVIAPFAQRAPNAVEFKTDPLPAPNDKTILHTIETPMLSPSWAVDNGVLYVSLSPEGVKSAIGNVGKNGEITENPEFAELWKKMGGKRISAFNFVDNAKVAADVYPTVERALAQYKADHPDEKISFVLPPLEKITANLSPSMSVTWTDGDGCHVKSVGPAPLFDMLPALSTFEMMGITAAKLPAAGAEKAGH